MNAKKYYVPSIEEFHVGFEYINSYTNGACDDTFTVQNNTMLYSIENSIEKGLIKVKYLSKEDIESEGWTLSGDFEKYKEENDKAFVYNKNINGDNHILIHIPKSNYVSIHGAKGVLWVDMENKEEISIPIITINTNDVLFRGTIKNKSVLSQVLKLINVK